MINKALLCAEKPLKVKIVSIDTIRAKLNFSDHQSVEVSSKYIPRGAKVGDELYLNFLSEETFHQTKDQIAKELLKDILSSDEG